MTVRLDIALSEETHRSAMLAVQRDGGTMSELVDAALRAELLRRSVAEHSQMLAEADDPDRLARRIRERDAAIAAWKASQK
jgi:hypothetical protein